MRVYIGPYKNWIGPYQISDKIPFISEDKRHEIGEWLSKTWVNNVCEWFYSKNERNIKVRIDKYDTWNMDNTLALIILPMLKQLKSTKHGSPSVDNEDLPEHMRHGDPEGYDNWVHYKWEWVLNEMIWAFEQELDDEWEDQFVHGEPDVEWIIVSGKEEDDSAMYEMKQKNPNYWVDREGIKEYNDRINNGFRLFGKYYRGLWD
jgi:hypothetical protein